MHGQVQKTSLRPNEDGMIIGLFKIINPVI